MSPFVSSNSHVNTSSGFKTATQFSSFWVHLVMIYTYFCVINTISYAVPLNHCLASSTCKYTHATYCVFVIFKVAVHILSMYTVVSMSKLSKKQTNFFMYVCLYVNLLFHRRLYTFCLLFCKYIDIQLHIQIT